MDENNERKEFHDDNQVYSLRSISSASSYCKDIPLSLPPGKSKLNNIDGVDIKQSTPTSVSKFTIRQYFEECVWPGLGLFGESYILFSIGILKPVWEMLYPECFVTMVKCSEEMIYGLSFSVVLGVILGMIVIGTLATNLGRRKGSLVTAFLMASSSFAMVWSTFLFSNYPNFLFQLMIFWLFTFGIGVGGEYPLSASSASERAMEEWRSRQRIEAEKMNLRMTGSDDTKPRENTFSRFFEERNGDNMSSSTTNNRGKRILLVFTMQGIGIFFNTFTITILLYILGQLGENGDLNGYYGNVSGVYESSKLKLIWRIVYFFGSAVLCYVFYSRFHYLNESAVWESFQKTKLDLNDISSETVTSPIKQAGNSVPSSNHDNYILHQEFNPKYATFTLLMKHYWHRLFGTSMTWLLWDIAFYGNKLYQSKFLLSLTGENTTLFTLTAGKALSNNVIDFFPNLRLTFYVHLNTFHYLILFNAISGYIKCFCCTLRLFYSSFPC